MSVYLLYVVLWDMDGSPFLLFGMGAFRCFLDSSMVYKEYNGRPVGSV